MRPHSLPARAAHPAAPAAAAQRKPRARKGNSHTEFTPQELERMVLEAAHERAEKARLRSGGG